MNRATLWSIATVILIAGLAASCADGGFTSNKATEDPGPKVGTTGLGGLGINGGLTESAVAIFRIAVNHDSQTATAELAAARTGQQTDDLYELGIGNFINEETLTVQAVRTTATTVELDYTVTHPFAAPVDLDATPTRTNRADLAVAGRVLFLLDVPSSSGNTYFSGAATGTVVANTSLVLNNDGYYAPAGLLDLPGLTANTFPYKVLVDETLDPRVSQADGLPRSNNGSALGNYSQSTGWQRDTMGPLYDGWTGHGVMHHGQVVHNTLTLDRSQLDAGEVFVFDAAIVVKYEDPRGGNNSTEKRSNRLPPTTADLAKFVYRHPHGSLDVEKVTFAGEDGSFLSNSISASELRFRVVDWDVYAPVTASADLSEDLSAASNVSPGEPGAPSLAVCIPGVLGDASTVVTFDPSALTDDDRAYGGDAGPETGIPGDALFYRQLVTKGSGSGQSDGLYTGMVRVVDVEDSLSTSYLQPLTEDLQPITENRPRPITYQHFQVTLGGGGTGGNFFPTLALSAPSLVTSGTGTSISVVSYSDPDGDPISVDIDWDNNGTFEDTRTLNGGSGSGQVWTSPISYSNATQINQTKYIPVRFTDGVMPTALTYQPMLQFNVGPNQGPTSISLSTPATVANGSGTIVQVISASDPEGDPVSVAIDWDNNPATAADVRTLVAPYTPIAYNSPILYTATSPSEVRQIPVTWGDALHPATTYIPELSFTLSTIIGSLPTIELSTPANVDSGTATSITVLSASDPDSNLLTLSIDWDNNPETPQETRTIAPPYTTPLTYVSPLTYKNATLTPGSRQIPVRVTDGVNPGTFYAPALSFTLGANRAPIVSGIPAVTNSPQSSPATFIMGPGNATAVDPEGDTPLTYTVTNNHTAATWTGSGFPISGLGSFAYPPISSVNFTVYANDPLHPTTSGTPYPTAPAAIACTASTPLLSANFNSSMNGFIYGPSYTPSLNNTDNSNKSSFSRCTTLAYMGAAFAGSCLTTGPDGGVCGSANDSYDQNVRNNVVSPAFSLVGRNNARAVFDSVFNGRPGTSSARYRVYATSNGSTWNMVYERYESSIPTVESDIEIDLAAYLGQPAVRLRFEFYDNSVSSTFAVSGGRYAGWSIDNVEVYACP